MTGKAWLQRAPLLGYFVLAFTWSWTFWLLSPLFKPQSPWLAMLLMFAGGFGPSVAAVAVVWRTRRLDGLRTWFWRCVHLKSGWSWLALAFFMPLVVILIAAGMHIALGGSIALSPAIGHFPLAVMNLFGVLLVGGPLGEEFGWRGYALPSLQARMGWRVASLFLGLVWGVWHLPLFYISDTVQAQMTLVLFLLSTVAMSVLFAWLARHTGGSVIVALVLHTAINFWPAIVPVLPTLQSWRPYALVVVIQVLLAFWLLVCPGPDATSGLDKATP